jgi:hypothetical protein
LAMSPADNHLGECNYSRPISTQMQRSQSLTLFGG